MNTNINQPKRALISVSNKEGIVELAKGLNELGVEIISTGGTFKTITDAGIPAIEISQYTGFPEMMDGRVKTLHPIVHGGILGLRDEHARVASEHNIKWIDLVIVNLYPFSETTQKAGVTDDEAIENIDIGGPTMIRSAAKNIGWVGVVVDPTDYTPLLDELKTGGLTYETRKKLRNKAFSHTGEYDTLISNYLHKQSANEATDTLSLSKGEMPERQRGFDEEKFPDTLNLTYKKHYDLRYGENPHQEAAVYIEPNNKENNLLNAKIHQGKQLSYNNLNDADGTLATLREFTEPACVVVKHANPCGVATGDNITEVFKRAYNADAMSAFGGLIAINRPCSKKIAEEIVKVFAEIVMAPSYEDGALEIFTTKKNLRVLELGTMGPLHDKQEIKYIDGGLLVQDIDTKIITKDDLNFVTEKQPTEEEINTMLFAWKVLKHVKSNGILIAKRSLSASSRHVANANTTIGIGPGQVSRVDAVDIAIKKSTKNSASWQAGDKINGSILASDAFFPFRDSIDKIAQTGIKTIIQPGGSIKDDEVIQACNEHGIAMVFTGVRCFKH